MCKCPHAQWNCKNSWFWIFKSLWCLIEWLTIIPDSMRFSPIYVSIDSERRKVFIIDRRVESRHNDLSPSFRQIPMAWFDCRPFKNINIRDSFDFSCNPPCHEVHLRFNIFNAADRGIEPSHLEQIVRNAHLPLLRREPKRIHWASQ